MMVKSDQFHVTMHPSSAWPGVFVKGQEAVQIARWVRLAMRSRSNSMKPVRDFIAAARLEQFADAAEGCVVSQDFAASCGELPQG